MPAGETAKLDKLAEALFQRPTLSLEITGSVNLARDRIPLARHKLEQELKAMWVKEQTDAGKPAVSLDQVQLDPGEFERLLRKKYEATFGHRYRPTEVPTNSVGVVTNSIAARLAALPPEVREDHGASLLLTRHKPGAKPAPKAGSPAAAALSAPPSVPQTRAELELADMEDQLVQKTEVTGDDFRDLMQQRAGQVQAYLLKTQKVTGERLFIMAPKPVDAASTGEDRVNLSLD